MDAGPVSTVFLAGFSGVQGLDVVGPAEVFSSANRRLQRVAYDVKLVSATGEPVRSISGIELATHALSTVEPKEGDIVLVGGGDEAGVVSAIQSPLVPWLARVAPRVRRIGSVCVGTFVLAAAGVLDGKRAATHWASCARLQQAFPSVIVQSDPIFVHDGKVWTSAGITTGIDMCLAMVEEDHGRKLADAVAGWLVLYARRPGFQSQFSDTLVAQLDASDPLGPALKWMRDNPRQLTDVPQLARRAGMSIRTLHRRCIELGTTPAKLIESVRVEHARTLLRTTKLGAKTIAHRSGFDNASRMARAFQRAFGVAPHEYRLMNGPS